jgi:hypothetical protein
MTLRDPDLTGVNGGGDRIEKNLRIFIPALFGRETITLVPSPECFARRSRAGGMGCFRLSP